jgi:hypothetical protein
MGTVLDPQIWARFRGKSYTEQRFGGQRDFHIHWCVGWSGLPTHLTFLILGVAVYYLSPRWPYAVSTRLSLDGAPSVLVNLTDSYSSPSPAGGSESSLSSVAWSATGLANKSHTLVATYGNFIIVDGFMCVHFP